MNRKPPSFPFYAKDWKSSLSVRRMTAQQRGFYIQLLAEAWDSPEPGFIPMEAPVWWVAGAISEFEFESSREIVMGCFKRDNRGRYYSEKLVEVRKQQLEWREKCSAGGKKSRKLKSTKEIVMEDKVTSSTPVEVTVAKANSKSRSKSKNGFLRPEYPEILDYMEEIGKGQYAAESFVNYYDSNGWKVGKNPMKDWKAAARNWKSNGNGGLFNGQYQSKADRISIGNKVAAAEVYARRRERDNQAPSGVGSSDEPRTQA